MHVLTKLVWSVLLLLVRKETSVAANPVFDIRLDRNGTYRLFWQVDYGNREVSFEVHALLKPFHWFALGFSNYGDKDGADVCVLWTDWKKTVHFQDAYTDEKGLMHVDKEQDCTDFRFRRQGDLTKFTFKRKFDTCDDEDYIIEDGTTHVLWGHGRGPLFRLEGVNFVGSPGEMNRVQLLRPTSPPPPRPPGVKTLDVVADRVRVPSSDTTYWCHVQRLSPDFVRKHHVLQFEAKIQEGNEPLVHHMEVFHCEAPPNVDIPEFRGPCDDPARPKETHVCNRVLAAWAMGATPFVYPKEAGLPIGGPDYNRYVRLEIHYNNPEKRDDWVDSSGVQFFVTDRLRPFDAGVMELGLEYSDKMAIPPRQAAFMLSGHCIPECTAVGLPQGGIVIFGSQLHTHLTGVKVITRHVRDGRELAMLNHDNHYSTEFQEIRILKRPVRVLPGDGLITSCWHKTIDRANITLGGFAISEEMCVNYVHYFPRVDLEVCKSSVTTQALNTYFRFLHEWEGQPTSPSKGISDNYKSIEWTPLRSAMLHDLYQSIPLSMQCNQSDGNRFPGSWENLPPVTVTLPLPPPARNCPDEDDSAEKSPELDEEDDVRKRTNEEPVRKRIDDEDVRKRLEENDLRKRLNEEIRKRINDDVVRKRVEEEEVRKRYDEEDIRKLLDDENVRKRVDQDDDGQGTGEGEVEDEEEELASETLLQDDDIKRKRKKKQMGLQNGPQWNDILSGQEEVVAAEEHVH